MEAVSRIPLLALAGTVGAISLFCASLSQPEKMIDRSFVHAFEDLHVKPATADGDAGAALDPAFLQLSGFPATVAPGSGSATIYNRGDRFAFRAADGSGRAYVVIDVRPVSLADRNAVHGVRRVVVVTAQTDDGERAGSSRQLLRFIIESPETVASPPTPRAL